MHTDKSDNLSMSWGRDYASPLHGRYEYVIFRGEEVALREGGFKSSASAKRAGIKAAQSLPGFDQ